MIERIRVPREWMAMAAEDEKVHVGFQEPKMLVVVHGALVYNIPREKTPVHRLRANDFAMAAQVVRGCNMVRLADGGCVPLDMLRPLFLQAGDSVATCPVIETDRIARYGEKQAKGLLPWQKKKQRAPLPRVRSDAYKHYNRVCRVDSLRNLGVKVTYTKNGPFWALADGNVWLSSFRKELRYVVRGDVSVGDKCVVWGPFGECLWLSFTTRKA